MIAAAIEGENLIVLYKAPEELRREWHNFFATRDVTLKKISSDHDLIKAALDGDEATLAKAADPDVTMAKLEAAKLKASDGSLSLLTGAKIVAWLDDYNRTYDRLRYMEKRSERWNALLGQGR